MCKAQLKAINLIPLFSWLLQRGKCHNCKSKISWRYPLIEVCCAALFVVTFYALNEQITLKLFLFLLIGFILLIMSIIDIERYFIPNLSQYFLAVAVTLLNLYRSNWYNALVGQNVKIGLIFVAAALLLFCLFYVLAKVEALGVDDVKLLFLIGFLLGKENWLLFTALCGLSGVIFGSLWQKLKHDTTFPFAPALCFAAYATLLIDEKFHPQNLLPTMTKYLL